MSYGRDRKAVLVRKASQILRQTSGDAEASDASSLASSTSEAAPIATRRPRRSITTSPSKAAAGVRPRRSEGMAASSEVVHRKPSVSTRTPRERRAGFTFGSPDAGAESDAEPSAPSDPATADEGEPPSPVRPDRKRKGKRKDKRDDAREGGKKGKRKHKKWVASPYFWLSVVAKKGGGQERK